MVRMEKCPLSIVTINLNNLAGLRKTMESVLNQNWQDFQYIVIDGGSSDGSKEYIESKKDELYYWISEPDKGIYNAMNKGILKSSGKYLLFLNSGDNLIDDGALESSILFLKDKDLIYFDLEMYDDYRRFIKKYPEELSFAHFFYDSLPHPATFIKKSLLERAGLFDENFKIVSDWKFFLDAVCRDNCSYQHVSECLTQYNLFGLSSSEKSRSLISRERRQVLNENYSAFLQDYRKLKEYETAITELRKSRKIQLLLKFRLLNKF